jgi:hypothetical protein
LIGLQRGRSRLFIQRTLRVTLGSVDRIAFVRHKMNDDRDECLHGSLAIFDDIFDYFPYRKRPDGDIGACRKA